MISGELLIRPAATDDRRKSQREDLEIQPGAPHIDVLAVEGHHLFEVVDIAAAAYLPEPGDSRAGCQAKEVMVLVLVQILVEERPGTDEGHLSSKHVDELREPVQAPSAEKRPDARNPRVIGDLEQA